MSNPVLDNPQLVSGAAILLSFFVGYKYALRSRQTPKVEDAAKQSEPVADEAAAGGDWVSGWGSMVRCL